MSAGVSTKPLSLTQQSTSFKNKLLNNAKETHLIVAVLKQNSLPLHSLPVCTQTLYRKKFLYEAFYSLTVSQHFEHNHHVCAQLKIHLSTCSRLVRNSCCAAVVSRESKSSFFNASSSSFKSRFCFSALLRAAFSASKSS